MEVVKRIKLDFGRSLNPIVVYAKQGDVNSRIIEIIPMFNGMPYIIQGGIVARFACKKPDGKQIYNDASSIVDNIIRVVLTEQTLAVAGEAVATISLYDSAQDKVLSTQNFIINIESNPIVGADIESSDEYLAYVNALLKIVDIEIDQTLTREGMAADAKITGDRINELEAEIELRLNDIEEDIEDLLYKAITVTEFVNNVGTVEKGTVVDADEITLSWVLSKAPKTLTVNGVSVTPTRTGSVLLSDVSSVESVSGSTSWLIRATDERDAAASKPTAANFYNGVYYGVAEAPDTINNAFIKTLTKTLRGSKLTSFNANVTEGKYLWYCLPVSYGTCTFYLGVLPGGMGLVDTILFENDSGFEENYYVYRSDYMGLGNKSVKVE